jgi:hypothetical protein
MNRILSSTDRSGWDDWSRHHSTASSAAASADAVLEASAAPAASAAVGVALRRPALLLLAVPSGVCGARGLAGAAGDFGGSPPCRLEDAQPLVAHLITQVPDIDSAGSCELLMFRIRTTPVA